MKLKQEQKRHLCQQYSVQKVAQDTGAPESQIALSTHRIQYLTTHLQSNPKDKAARRGLIKLVSNRKRQLTYLKQKGIERYRDIIASLGLRK